MTKDERFLAEAQRLSLDVSPSTGESVQEFVTRIYASPKAIVDRARRAAPRLINRRPDRKQAR